jgi:hypothetical protein
MWPQLPRVVAILIASVALAACGGGSDSGDRMAPPSSLSYTSPVQATAEEALVPLMPTVTGSVALYSVSPALPAGLTISPVTGVISGTPTTASAATTFTITASNSAGSTSFVWQLTVLPPPPVTANAGTSQSVSAGSFVTLDGSASRTRVGGSLAYKWELTSMPSGSAAAFASPSSVKPIFLADLHGTYTASLTVSDGAYRSTASNVSVTVTAPVPRVPPPTAADTVPISQCQAITKPGNYLLTRDLSVPDGAYECITIHDTTNAVLDCGNHMLSGGIPDGQFRIRALSIRNVQGFSVIKCRLHIEWIQVDDSANGRFTDNTFTNVERDVHQAHLVFLRGQDMLVAYNTFVGVTVSQNFGDSMTVTNNRFALEPGVTYLTWFVDSHFATRTRIVANAMDGGWHGPQGSRYGADNGVLLGDATDALVQNNTIANVFGAAIEWTGTLRSSTIAANYIVNAGDGGFGAWYWNSSVGSRFQQNIVDDAPLMFNFYRIYGLRAAGHECSPCEPPGTWPADTAVMFRDNVFDGNVLRNVMPGAVAAGWLPVFNQLGYLGSVSGYIGERVPTAEEFEFVNNTFRNNVFDMTLDAPLFGYNPVVPGMIVDGGFNVCRQPATPDYPLKCTL